MGDDAFRSLATWKEWQQLFHYAHIIVLDRTNHGEAEIPAELDAELLQRERQDKNQLKDSDAGYIYRLQIPAIDISSSMIRSRLAAHQDITDLVPEKISSYIHTHNLYGAR